MVYNLIETLIEKWEDVQNCTEDPIEQALIQEFLDDLELIARG